MTTPSEAENSERTTCPMQDYTLCQVCIGAIILVIGLYLTIAVPILMNTYPERYIATLQWIGGQVGWYVKAISASIIGGYVFARFIGVSGAEIRPEVRELKNELDNFAEQVTSGIVEAIFKTILTVALIAVGLVLIWILIALIQLFVDLAIEGLRMIRDILGELVIWIAGVVLLTVVAGGVLFVFWRWRAVSANEGEGLYFVDIDQLLKWAKPLAVISTIGLIIAIIIIYPSNLDDILWDLIQYSNLWLLVAPLILLLYTIRLFSHSRARTELMDAVISHDEIEFQIKNTSHTADITLRIYPIFDGELLEMAEHWNLGHIRQTQQEQLEKRDLNWTAPLYPQNLRGGLPFRVKIDPRDFRWFSTHPFPYHIDVAREELDRARDIFGNEVLDEFEDIAGFGPSVENRMPNLYDYIDIDQTDELALLVEQTGEVYRFSLTEDEVEPIGKSGLVRRGRIRNGEFETYNRLWTWVSRWWRKLLPVYSL